MAYSYSPICPLLFMLFFIISCSGQVNTNPPKEMTKASKQIPEIIGTPPPLFPLHNPYNDTGLVSQYIRSIFQDSKGNYWFGPAAESVARYDGKTLEYYSKAEFFHGNDSRDLENVNSVHAIAEDKKGNIWFGTYHGVIKYDGKTFRSYTEKDGLSNTKVGRQRTDEQSLVRPMKI